MLELRLPRVAAGFAVGALLAQGGCLLQILLRNPLAEPYVLGVSGGAALAALVALALAASVAQTAAASACGAGFSLAVLLVVARSEFASNGSTLASERLLLAGVMLAALWGALMTLTLSLASQARLQSLVFWLMGDLSGARAAWPAWLALAAVALIAQFDAKGLNLLGRGEEHAHALGVTTGALKRRVVILAAIASGAAVSIAGTVGFVGLLAPHAVRRITGNDQRVLLPAAALAGGTFVVLCDALARTVLAPRQLPVGALTALFGAPLFLVLMRRVR
jgi:iron complex transport system permease protein